MANTPAKRGSKTAFILQHIDKSPDEIVSLAKHAGMTIARSLVYNARSKVQVKGAGKNPIDKRVQLRALVIALGLDTAEAVFTEVKQTIMKG